MEKRESDFEVLLDGEHHKRITILLLTQEHCALCEQAKETLERLSREYWLSVSTLDIGSSEGQRLATQGGLLFPPGILIDGEPFSYGRLSERKLRRELDRRLGFVCIDQSTKPSRGHQATLRVEHSASPPLSRSSGYALRLRGAHKQKERHPCETEQREYLSW